MCTYYTIETNSSVKCEIFSLFFYRFSLFCNIYALKQVSNQVMLQEYKWLCSDLYLYDAKLLLVYFPFILYGFFLGADVKTAKCVCTSMFNVYVCVSVYVRPLVSDTDEQKGKNNGFRESETKRA